MQKFLISLVFLGCLLAPLHAQTTLSGNIAGVTLEASGNPYLVTDNLTIPEGKSVTIKEGCVFLFRQFAGLVVEGSLNVQGTLQKPVVFTTVNDDKHNPDAETMPNPFDWNGILIAKKAGSVTFSNVIVEYSVYGIKSMKEALVLNNATFNANGQFHLTIEEKIKPVVEGQPYSYAQGNGQTPIQSKDSAKKVWYKRPVPRILLGCVALGGVGAGLYFNQAAANEESHRADLFRELMAQGGDVDQNLYNAQNQVSFDKSNKAMIARNVSYIVAGLGFVGLSVTFIF